MKLEDLKSDDVLSIEQWIVLYEDIFRTHSITSQDLFGGDRLISIKRIYRLDFNGEAKECWSGKLISFIVKK